MVLVLVLVLVVLVVLVLVVVVVLGLVVFRRVAQTVVVVARGPGRGTGRSSWEHKQLQRGAYS